MVRNSVATAARIATSQVRMLLTTASTESAASTAPGCAACAAEPSPSRNTALAARMTVVMTATAASSRTSAAVPARRWLPWSGPVAARRRGRPRTVFSLIEGVPPKRAGRPQAGRGAASGMGESAGPRRTASGMPTGAAVLLHEGSGWEPESDGVSAPSAEPVGVRRGPALTDDKNGDQIGKRRSAGVLTALLWLLHREG